MESPQAAATANKVATAKQKKEAADQAFKIGNTSAALRSYHEALLYLTGLDKNALQSIGMASPLPTAAGTSGEAPKEKTEVDEIVEKIYANMCACHIKNKNWKRAVETADKALAKNPDNHKASFRKAKAWGEQGFFDKAKKILDELRTKTPDDTAAIDAEYARLKVIDDDREKVHKAAWKGFLNKAPPKESSTADSKEPAATAA
ncbi:TPR-like protein [Pluteus cervinus]|uniref:TPR-like protein n=1 Tax=Pluteus cervinus TaxID=181527 RepID=A0ACD3BAV0_9AGAR|nr:TPR-like protein [Pluteus cervinus]